MAVAKAALEVVTSATRMANAAAQEATADFLGMAEASLAMVAGKSGPVVKAVANTVRVVMTVETGSAELVAWAAVRWEAVGSAEG